METYELYFNEINDTEEELTNILNRETIITKDRIEEYITIQRNFIFRLRGELGDIFEKKYNEDEWNHIEWEYDDFLKAIENFWKNYEEEEEEEARQEKTPIILNEFYNELAILETYFNHIKNDIFLQFKRQGGTYTNFNQIDKHILGASNIPEETKKGIYHNIMWQILKQDETLDMEMRRLILDNLLENRSHWKPKQ